MKEELTRICKDLKEVREDCKLSNLDDNTLFDCAVRILNSSRVEQNKKEQGEERKPTEKQLNFLKKNGYTGDMSKLNFHDASQLISEFLEGLKQK